jgi:hypothetical protein
MRIITFLPDPPAIRATLYELSQKSGRLDIAVAFVGSDWWDLLGNFSGQIRIVCWLSSTNTNPRAVADMIDRGHIKVKQHDSMHAKVYLAPRLGAIVGSANLSKAALTHIDTAGQSEAAVLVRDQAAMSAITSWFQGLWTAPDTRKITKVDLVSAMRAWDAARKRDWPTGATGARTSGKRNGFVFPPLPKVPADLARLASRLRDLKLEASLGGHYKFFSSLDPRVINPSERSQIAKYLTSWNKREWVTASILKEPITRTRRGLTLLYDESKDIRDRLDRVEDEGLLPGLRIPSLSQLLYWRKPRRYSPFNKKTDFFLTRNKLRLRGASKANGASYANWLSYSTRLQHWLGLPTQGHVDRVVSAYYDRFAPKKQISSKA